MKLLHKEPVANLRRLREQQRLSVRGAARAIGVSPATIQRAEAGGNVNPHQAKLISRFYGIAISDWHPKLKGPNA